MRNKKKKDSMKLKRIKMKTYDCPKCNETYTYDIGYDVRECSKCHNTWTCKSLIGFEYLKEEHKFMQTFKNKLQKIRKSNKY